MPNSIDRSIEIQNELKAMALSIFYKIRKYLPPKVMNDYLWSTHEEFSNKYMKSLPEKEIL